MQEYSGDLVWELVTRVASSSYEWLYWLTAVLIGLDILVLVAWISTLNVNPVLPTEGL